ncbi:hypothetical protein FA95DRAFT_1610671 [Auriscalpium vulgare]|uniref:Uncharacterized protein n=1 Tax=Auriscalpium vulgare TaxID=40419 RepID=A0ACB8RE27_9AGAM|nr:hypothetical protein FA95DRAFT_1610671 [Auriscalpium vulgare]
MENYERWQDPYSTDSSLSSLISPPLSVERLGLKELMRNTVVQELFNSHLQQGNEVLRLNSHVQSLTQQNEDLKDRLRRADTVSRGSTPSLTSTDYSSRGSTPSVASIGRSSSHPTQPTTTQRHMMAVRPAHCHPAVLWDKDDCRGDDDSGWTKSNAQRPPMSQCIRNEDGTMIHPNVYRSIRNSVRIVAAQLIGKLKEADRSKPRYITFFRSFYPSELNDATERLEEMQPLLALCSNHWKAEQMLTNALRGRKGGRDGGDADDDDDDNDVDDAVAAPSNAKQDSRKRRKDAQSTPLRPTTDKKKVRPTPVSPIRLRTYSLSWMGNLIAEVVYL